MQIIKMFREKYKKDVVIFVSLSKRIKTQLKTLKIRS
jgi:hypothetical protein